MTRPRLLAGLALFSLAGYYLGKAARTRPEPARTAFVVAAPVLGRLRRAEWCPACRHLGDDHDPDLGCLVIACPCRRLRCLCPGAQPPDDR